jgi:hypothetical protein
MSEFWKIGLTAVSLLGVAAIIFQLNQGTLAQAGLTTFSNVVGTAFTSSGQQTSASTGGATPSGNGSSGSNQNQNTVNHSTAN